ncbi:pentatricopeptide repeat-containing protein At5g27270 isoform X3 [Rhodamnia argentea]|uniref:Pentatricopeptide repeat-containing protein At5g27270 isoform X3 n=1 Tax=Rhodamnia argentea TaxID=178133 RepID=A0ABM3GSI4_9MYRT|nr:pentatricopeptide repeat-containing protein At5g27270 isoform X3 [Rhodamnia argentea]
MEWARSSFFSGNCLLPLLPATPKSSKPSPLRSSVSPDPWSLSDGLNKPKPRSKNPKNPLSDDNARRIIKAKARYLSALRRNQGSRVQTTKWIKRTPEQMVRYLQDDRDGHLYGKHVVAAIKTVRALAEKREGEYDMRMVMSGFVSKLTFREMCVVLKEQKGWRQVRDFFAWMKLQFSYRPSVIVYTIVLRMYGQVGKIKLAEQTFLEMLEAGCEPDEVACGTLLCTYARWGRHKAMLSFYSAVEERGVMPSVAVFNFMLSSLQKKSLHQNVVDLWRKMVDKRVAPNGFTYTVVISSLIKEGCGDEALQTFYEMKNAGFLPEEVTYSLLINLCAKNGSWDEAINLYEDMRFLKIIPSNYTRASLLTLCYRKGDYSRALALFSEMGRHKVGPDEVIYGLLIRIYGKLGLYEDAENTFKEIEHLGLLTDEKTYLAMAQVHLSSGNAEKALNVIELMKSKEIWFSRYAYIVLLQCYVKRRNLDSAEGAFLALSKTGLPDAGSFNDMLNLYINLDQTEKAKEFTFQIREDLVKFDEELFKTIIRFYCKNGMISEAEQFAQEIGGVGSFADNKFVQTFYRIIHGLYKGQEKHAKSTVIPDLFDSMALGLMLTLYLADGSLRNTEYILKLLLETADGLSIASKLIGNFVREGDISKAEALNSHLIRLGCRAEDEAVASMISWYAKGEKLDKAEAIFLKADSPLSGKLVFKCMIDAYAKSGRPEDAYLLYRKATEKGHDLGPVTISIIVNALTNVGKHQEAEDIVRKNLQESPELDTVLFNTFIKAMLEAGKLNFAESIYEQMLSLGVAPSIRTFNTMISVYGRGGKLNKAAEMFGTARGLSLPLDEKAYMNLIGFYCKAGYLQCLDKLMCICWMV